MMLAQASHHRPAGIRPRRRADGRHLVRARGLARLRHATCSRRCSARGVDAHGRRRHPGTARALTAPADGASTACSTSCTAAAAARTASLQGALECARRALHRHRACSAPRSSWTRSAPSRSGCRSACRRRLRRASQRGDDVGRCGAQARPAGDRQAGERGLERRRDPLLQATPTCRRPSALAARYDGALLVEQLIQGDEYTVGVLGGEALPSIRIVPPASTTTTTPSTSPTTRSTSAPGASGATEQRTRQPGARGVLRRRRAAAGAASTSCATAPAGRGCWRSTPRPGMTSHSLVPKAARAAASTSTNWSGACSRPASRVRGRAEGGMMLPWQEPQSPPDAQGEPWRLLERIDWRALGDVGGHASRAASVLGVAAGAGARPARASACSSRARSSASRRRRSRARSSRSCRAGSPRVDLDARARARSSSIALGRPRGRAARAGPTRSARASSPSRWPRRAGTRPACSTRAASCSSRNARYVPPELPLLAGPGGQRGRGRAAATSTSQGRLVERGPAPHRRAARRARRLGARPRQRRRACGSAGSAVDRAPRALHPPSRSPLVAQRAGGDRLRGHALHQWIRVGWNAPCPRVAVRPRRRTRHPDA